MKPAKLRLIVMGTMVVYASCGQSSDNGNASAGAPVNVITPSVAAGRRIFEQRCASCHGFYGKARVNNAEDLTLTRLDSPGIAETINDGRGTMPGFKHALNDTEIKHVVAYVLSIRK
jgi:mono/diheme cytochrome c family protein